MPKQIIASKDAPAAIGPYSQAVRVGDTVYMSGQIGLDPTTGMLVEGIEAQAHQVFLNMRAVSEAAGATLDDVVKLTLFLVDMGDFAKVNEIMQSYFKSPYPARSTVEVAGLPRGARVEVEGHPSVCDAEGCRAVSENQYGSRSFRIGGRSRIQRGRFGNACIAGEAPREPARRASRAASQTAPRAVRMPGKRLSTQGPPSASRNAAKPARDRARRQARASSASRATRTSCSTCRCATRTTRRSFAIGELKAGETAQAEGIVVNTDIQYRPRRQLVCLLEDGGGARRTRTIGAALLLVLSEPAEGARRRQSRARVR